MVSTAQKRVGTRGYIMVFIPKGRPLGRSARSLEGRGGEATAIETACQCSLGRADEGRAAVMSCPWAGV